MDDTLRLGELVEPLGYDSIWATEHYGSAYSMQPNPLQYLAYWAGRTSRVDVGTAVIVAPWWNPVRLASEIIMLDILLKGRRLHLGIGRGVAPHEYASLGIPIEESHTYFYDVVNAIRASDGAERFTFDGQVFKIPPTTIRPQARHKGDLTKRIKAAFTTKKSAQLAAENGLGQMFVSGDDLDVDDRARSSSSTRSAPGSGCRPTSPPRCCGCTAPRPRRRPRRAGPTSTTSCTAAQHHYFEWNNPGFKGIKGYEEYAARTRPTWAAPTPASPRAGPRSPSARPTQIIERIQVDPAGHQPRDAGHPLLLRRHAAREGRGEPAPVRREGAPRGAGHGHARSTPSRSGSPRPERGRSRRARPR